MPEKLVHRIVLCVRPCLTGLDSLRKQVEVLLAHDLKASKDNTLSAAIMDEALGELTKLVNKAKVKSLPYLHPASFCK